MKKIIVPTDFSENAITSGKIAASIAEQINACLEFVHAYSFLQSNFQGNNQREQEEAVSKAMAQMDMKHYIQTLKLPNALTFQVVLGGSSVLELLKPYEDDPDVVLLVTGTQGASGFKYQFLGSNSFDIAKQIQLPLLIVPKEANVTKLKNILFFTDFQPKDLNTLEGIQEIFDESSLACQVVHLHSSGIFSMQENQLRLENIIFMLRGGVRLDVHGTVEVAPENSVGVKMVIEKYRPDWVTLTMTDRDILDRLLDKSLAKKIILNPTLPVFINNRTLNYES